MVRLAAAVFACTAVVVAVPAQRPPLRVLLGQQIVDCDTQQATVRLPILDRLPPPERLAGSVYCAGDVTIDAAQGQMLSLLPGRVVLTALGDDPAGKVLWSVDRTASHTDTAIVGPQCWLAGDRVVLPRGGGSGEATGGIVALDRATGAIVWERSGVPSTRILVDGDLVITAGKVAGTETLAAMSLANGARAFAEPLDVRPPGGANSLVDGPHGIAVVLDAGFVVHDRAWSRLFAAAGRPAALVAGTDGWFSVQSDEVVSWTRTGERRWAVRHPIGDFEQVALTALADGRVVHFRHHGMSDTGFDAACFGARDGEVEWTRREPGLGIAHSKYWHRVSARTFGERLIFASQGAGGAFLVELDPATGDRRERARFDPR